MKIDIVKGCIFSIGIKLEDVVLDRLLGYLSYLAKWNRVFNLTAIRDEKKMIVQHLLDCLSILPTLDKLSPKKLIDVGSGGGLPGIIVAIARPHWSVTLNDINSKKIAFLLQVRTVFALKNVQVLKAHVEDIDSSNTFDIVMCRAFKRPSNFVYLSQHLLAPKGYFVAMQGKKNAEDIERLISQSLTIQILSLKVPMLSADRNLIVMQPSSSVA